MCSYIEISQYDSCNFSLLIRQIWACLIVYQYLLFVSAIQLDLIIWFLWNYRARMHRRKYGTHHNHLVSSTFVWKESIRRKARNFSGTEIGEKRKLWRGALCTRSRGGLLRTCRFSRTLLCSPIGWIAHNFSPYTLPSGYPKLLSISFYHLWYLCEKMIHW